MLENEPLWRCGDLALLRVPIHPAHRANEACFGPESGDGVEGSRRLLSYVRRCAADPLVREAIGISSPSLSDKIMTALTAEKLPEARAVRRMARALTGYRLRMATRATPFGLMAGVAAAEFTKDAADTKVRFGDAHRRAVRPDRGWLLGLISGWERRPAVLRYLRLTRNNLCTVRGDRVVLTYRPILAGEVGGENVKEVTVRHTRPVELALRMAENPISYRQLESRLCSAFPSADAGAVSTLLQQLVESDILLTELRPPPDSTDPLGHVLEILAAIDAAVVPELAELRSVSEELRAYADTSLGAGREAFSVVRRRMLRLRQSEHPVQVDLALDAEVRLPSVVAEEAARAADMLWRIAPAAPDSLRAYHAAFVERFGLGRVVAVQEVLDPDIGLGAPAGYRMPPSPRQVSPVGETGDRQRDRVLAALVDEALRSGKREVVVTDEPDDPVASCLAARDTTAPPAAELFARLLARSLPALQAGDFRLVVSGCSGLAGATFGRFAYLLPETSTSVLRDQVAVAARDPDVLRAQLVFQPLAGRIGNVTQVPRMLDHRIPVGIFTDTSRPGEFALERLAVCADDTRLFLVDCETGREVAPSPFHLLNPQTQAPNLARFLTEIAGSGLRPWGSWQWGAVEALPYLPRVRYGRTVLCPARWRVDDALRDQDLSLSDWLKLVQRWRETLNVPQRVRLALFDHCIDLDLTDTVHLQVLRHAVKDHTDAMVQESFADQSAGWLTGPEGSHHNEIVFPLIPARHTTARPPAKARRSRPAHRTAFTECFPGGPWLSAALYSSPGVQDEILARWLPHLLDQLPAEVDRWFYVRYRDHARGPHLRLRFHGDPEVLAAKFLPVLHAWTTGLQARNLAGWLTLDTYNPEVERYGGPDSLEAAERVFHADSVAAIEQLRLLRSQELTIEPVLLAAANLVDLLRTFWSAGTGAELPAERPWEEWLLATVPRDRAREAFHKRRQEAVELLDPDGVWPALRRRDGAAVLTAWAQRAPAVAAYGQVLRRTLGSGAWTQPAQVLPSLFHMHHNRLIGTDEESEWAAHALARGAVQAQRDRRRHVR